MNYDLSSIYLSLVYVPIYLSLVYVPIYLSLVYVPWVNRLSKPYSILLLGIVNVIRNGLAFSSPEFTE